MSSSSANATKGKSEMTGKVARLMAVMEANIDAQIRSERVVGIYIPGVTPKPKKVDRTLEKALRAELTIPEIVEFERRRRAKAKAFWEAGDNYAKYLWGGW
jgi:hypothetical protein